MSVRTFGLYLFFGIVIVGALTASYLHLAAWLEPWMPDGWERWSYAAALALDGLILAPIVARQIVGVEVPGRWLPAAQWTGLVASFYVNARWGATTMKDSTWMDVGVGAALFPLLAWIAEGAMRSCVATIQALDQQDALDAAHEVWLAELEAAEQGRKEEAQRTRTERHLARSRARSGASITLFVPNLDGQDVPDGDDPELPRRVPREMAIQQWRAWAARYGDDPAEVAAKTGRPLRTIQNWRQWAQQLTPARMPKLQ